MSSHAVHDCKASNVLAQLGVGTAHGETNDRLAEQAGDLQITRRSVMETGDKARGKNTHETVLGSEIVNNEGADKSAWDVEQAEITVKRQVQMNGGGFTYLETTFQPKVV